MYKQTQNKLMNNINLWCYLLNLNKMQKSDQIHIGTRELQDLYQMFHGGGHMWVEKCTMES